VAGSLSSINPETGAEEFGFFNNILDRMRGSSNQLDLTGIENPLPAKRMDINKTDLVAREIDQTYVPNYQLSRMIPTEHGAEGRIFSNDAVQSRNINLGGPISSGYKIGGRKIENYTDQEIEDLKNKYDGYAKASTPVGAAIGWLGGKAGAIASGAADVQFDGWADQARALEREQWWRRYIRSHASP